jgi:hypothetical protein
VLQGGVLMHLFNGARGPQAKKVNKTHRVAWPRIFKLAQNFDWKPLLET